MSRGRAAHARSDTHRPASRAGGSRLRRARPDVTANAARARPAQSQRRREPLSNARRAASRREHGRFHARCKVDSCSVTDASAPNRRLASVPIALLAVVLLHLALSAHFAPPRVVFSKEPVVMVDYALHAYQVDRALSAFRGWGKLWGYDPLVLAGQPAGVAEDLTSKGTELFVIGLRALGVH